MACNELIKSRLKRGAPNQAKISYGCRVKSGALKRNLISRHNRKKEDYEMKSWLKEAFSIFPIPITILLIGFVIAVISWIVATVLLLNTLF